MRDFVGVKSNLSIVVSRSLKREALMFSKVAIPDLRDITQPNPVHLTDENISFINEIEWLVEKGVIYQPELLPVDQNLINDDEYISAVKLKLGIDEDLDKLIEEGMGRHDPLFGELFIYADSLEVRYTAIQLRELNQVNVCPIFYNEPFAVNKLKADKTDIIQITLDRLPVPNEKTAWEQIIEYRSDPDSQSKFLALRNWMSEVARAELSPTEVEEKLEYLIDQYQQHMKLHRMKANTGTIETVIVTSAEILGDLLSIKWGEATKALFSLKRRQIALLEGELTSPGSEVAYIVKAREAFTK